MYRLKQHNISRLSNIKTLLKIKGFWRLLKVMETKIADFFNLLMETKIADFFNLLINLTI